MEGIQVFWLELESKEPVPKGEFEGRPPPAEH